MFFQFGQGAVFQFGRLAQVVFPLGHLDGVLGLLDLPFQLALASDGLLFLFPLRRKDREPLLLVGQFLLQGLQPLLGSLIGFLQQGLFLDLQLHHPPRQFVHFGRHGVDFRAQLGRGLVHQVDGLVRQKAVRDVAVRKHRGGHQRGVLDAHPVVHLVAVLQPAQDGDGVRHVGLGHVDLLKAALQGGVLFDVLAVFVQGGGPDAMEFATGQHGLEQVARVHGPLGLAGAHHVVQLIDEEDHRSVRILHFLQHGLEALFEFPPEFRPRDQRAQVQGDDAFVLHALGHVPAHHPLGESFHDGRLAHARLADQHRVVLGAPAQHLHHPPDFLIPSDHRVQLAGLGHFGQIAPEPGQRLEGVLRVGGGDAAAAPHGANRFQHRLAGQPRFGQIVLGRPGAFGLQQGQQQVFGADVFIAKILRFRFRANHHLVEAHARGEFPPASADLRLLVQQGPPAADEGVHVVAHLLQHMGRHAVLLFGQGQQQVHGVQFPVLHPHGQGMRPLQRGLRFFREILDLHGFLPLSGAGFFCAGPIPAARGGKEAGGSIAPCPRPGFSFPRLDLIRSLKTSNC